MKRARRRPHRARVLIGPWLSRSIRPDPIADARALDAVVRSIVPWQVEAVLRSLPIENPRVLTTIFNLHRADLLGLVEVRTTRRGGQRYAVSPRGSAVLRSLDRARSLGPPLDELPLIDVERRPR